MKKPDMVVSTQGSPKVNNLHWLKKYPTLRTAIVDMHSKYCEISATSSGPDGLSIYLSATEDSLHLQEECDLDDFTVISFPSLSEDWEIFNYSASKYALYITFERRSFINKLISKLKRILK